MKLELCGPQLNAIPNWGTTMTIETQTWGHPNTASCRRSSPALPVSHPTHAATARQWLTLDMAPESNCTASQTCAWERLGDGCACQYNIWRRRIYMCVYIYMYIFICTYIHTHTRIYIYIYIYTYVCIDTWYVYYCAFYNMCTHKSICIHIMYKDAYVQKYASMLPMDVAGYVSLSIYIIHN